MPLFSSPLQHSIPNRNVYVYHGRTVYVMLWARRCTAEHTVAIGLHCKAIPYNFIRIMIARLYGPFSIYILRLCFSKPPSKTLFELDRPLWVDSPSQGSGSMLQWLQLDSPHSFGKMEMGSFGSYPDSIIYLMPDHNNDRKLTQLSHSNNIDCQLHYRCPAHVSTLHYILNVTVIQSTRI